MAVQSPSRTANTKTRVLMVVILILILSTVGVLYLVMKNMSKQAQQENKHTFYEYVVTHHIGRLVLIDDGTGLDPASYMLELPQPIPPSQAENFSMNLMKLYVTYDHGQILSIVYTDPVTKKHHPIADIHYDDDRKLVTLTLTDQTGQTHRIVQHVNW